MKKIALLFSFLYAFTCYGQNDIIQEQGTNYSIEAKELHYANTDSSVRMDVRYPTIVPLRPSPAFDSINKFIHEKFIPSEEEIAKEITNTTMDGGMINVDFEAAYMTNNYLCLSYSYTEDFSGAAHATWSSEYYHFNVTTGRQLSFSDFFTDGIYPHIKKAVFKEFSAEKAEKEAAFDARQMSFDFYFKHTGCTSGSDDCLFLYITPYSEIPGLMSSSGYVPLELGIPKEEVLPYLKEEWKKEILH